MNESIYITTNPLKKAEVELLLVKKYGINVQFITPDFEVLEIQASNCGEVAKFRAKYAAEILQKPVLKSDSGLYIEALGGLPGPYNSYFCNQIGTEKFLKLLANEPNRKARLEHCFAYCEPSKEPIVFIGHSEGYISYEPRGKTGAWHDKFYIPKGENKTLSELRDIDHVYESKFWGNALSSFAEWYLQNKLNCERSKKI